MDFKTKKELEQHTRNIINTLGTCEIKEGDKYFTFFSELIKGNENYEFIKGCGINTFTISVNPLNKKAYHMMVKRIDNTECNFSWLKCCNKRIQSTRESLKRAMREAIKEDIIIYKKNSELICNECKIIGLDYSDYHVDHNIMSFQELSDHFIKETKRKIPETFDYCNINKMIKFKEEDNKFKKSWVKFHFNNMELQILCKKCNLKKSNN